MKLTFFVDPITLNQFFDTGRMMLNPMNFKMLESHVQVQIEVNTKEYGIVIKNAKEIFIYQK